MKYLMESRDNFRQEIIFIIEHRKFVLLFYDVIAKFSSFTQNIGLVM